MKIFINFANIYFCLILQHVLYFNASCLGNRGVIRMDHCGVLQTCSSLLAGDSLRSSKRYNALDETAVFGSGCRHEFPLLFIYLKHGKRYVLYLLLK